MFLCFSSKTIFPFSFSRALTTIHQPSLPVPHQPHHPLPFPSRRSSHDESDVKHFLARLQQRDGSDPSTPYHLNTAISASAKFASLFLGQQAHSISIKLGFESNIFIGTAIVDMYCKCGKMPYAEQLFDEMPDRNVVTWNSLISGYTRACSANEAIRLFIQMLKFGFNPTASTLSAVLVSCSQLESAELGIQVHCLTLKFGLSLDVVVGTTLVDMYSKCSNSNDSRKWFDEMPEKNVFTWSCMVSGYAQNQQSDEAMLLVREMQRSCILLNKVTYNSLLSSFSNPEELVYAKQVHCQVIIQGLDSDDYIAVTLLTMYAECGCIENFRKISTNISSRDQILWNSTIYGFCNLGKGDEALECFIEMRRDCVDIDDISLTNVLKAVGILSALEVGKQTHGLVLKIGFASNVSVENALVSMYARCGNIGDSKRIFLSIDQPDLVSWNSLLSGYAQHGYGEDVVVLFESMRKIGIKPDHTTFLSVLSACSHVGLLAKGLKYFALMKDEMVELPRVEHYACVVDLLGRAGQLSEAESFVNDMPIKPGPSVYKALLSACRVHGNMDIATRLAKQLLELWPNDPASYVLLSGVLAEGGQFDGAAGLQKLIGERGLTKKPGYSWIGLNEADPTAIMKREATNIQAMD